LPSNVAAYKPPAVAPETAGPEDGASVSTILISTDTSTTELVLEGVMIVKRSSLSSVPDIDHHLLEDEGGGTATTCAGRTPIVVSEITVDGELDPIHSTEEVKWAPVVLATLVHSSTFFRRIPSIIRLVVVVESAITIKFKRFARVIVAVVALGWPDESFPANAVVSERKSVEEATVFVGFDN